MNWIFFIAFEILRNWFLIEKLQLRPHYGYSHLIRWGSGAIFLFVRHPEFDPLGDPTTIFPAVVYGNFLWSSFYLFFDPGLNLLRGLPALYQGKNSGKLDKLPTRKYYLLKLATLVVFILSSIAIYYGKG